MQTCIYCNDRLHSGTRNAHVIPSAIGGRLRSKEFCCSACNNAIGSLERELIEDLRPLIAMVDPKRGDGRRVQPWKFRDSIAGTFLARGGTSSRAREAPKVIARDKAAIDFSLGSRTDDEAAEEIAHLLRRYKKTPADIGKSVSIGARNQTGLVALPITFSLNVGSPSHLRVLAKMPLELFALREPGMVRSPDLKSIIQYVRAGNGPADVTLDWGTTGLLVPPAASHLCEVWSSGRFLIGRVVLFGIYSFTVTLTAEWSGSPLVCAYCVDPLTGRVLVDASARREGPSPAGWPARHDGDVERKASIDGSLARVHQVNSRRRSAEAAKRTIAEWRENLGGHAPTRWDREELGAKVSTSGKLHARLNDVQTPYDERGMRDLVERVQRAFDRLARDD